MGARFLPAESCRPSGRALDLWRIRLVDPPPEDYELLSQEERERFDRLIVPSKRRQRIASRAALRRILAHYLGASPRELRFEYGEHGRPTLVGDPLRFNLSHSHEIAVVAVAHRGLVGADVEWKEPDRRLDALAERFFAPAEFESYSTLPVNDRFDVFYRTWCRKEAYVKAQGTGLSFSSRRFQVEMPTVEKSAASAQTLCTGSSWLLSTEMTGDAPSDWQGFEVEPAPDYVSAVFWKGPAREVRLFDADFSDADPPPGP